MTNRGKPPFGAPEDDAATIVSAPMEWNGLDPAPNSTTMPLGNDYRPLPLPPPLPARAPAAQVTPVMHRPQLGAPGSYAPPPLSPQYAQGWTPPVIAPAAPPQISPPQISPPQISPPQISPPQISPPQISPPQVAPRIVRTPLWAIVYLVLAVVTIALGLLILRGQAQLIGHY